MIFCLNYLFFPLIITEYISYGVKLCGQTKLKGIWISNGQIDATIVYPLGNFKFVIGALQGNELKLVQIQVIGETSFKHLGSKKNRGSPASCKVQETFTMDCYTSGERVGGTHRYNVELVAVVKRSG